MDELECMRNIDDALSSISDDTARTRIVNWLVAKHLGLSNSMGGTASAQRGTPRVDGAERTGEIAGIAKLSQAGEILLTVRDLKAKSANDAAIRLVHVLIWSAQKLTEATTVSSRHVITPWLQKYRCYDGNTRGAIAADKGIVRDGDDLSLDFHAEQRAEQIVNEILDNSVEGKWKPSNTRRRVSKVRTTVDGEAE